MNIDQRTRIERYLRFELQLQLDNLLFELKASAREGRPLCSADLILLASRLERLKGAGCEVLDLLDTERNKMDFNPRDRWKVLEQSA